MGLIGNLYKGVCELSPWIEVSLRHIYWRNVKTLKKFSPNKHKGVHTIEGAPVQHVDFEKVLQWLRDKGIGEGSLLLIHSSYDGLSATGLSPEEMVDKLLELVGKTGTLCMPVIRKFKGEPKAEDLLTTNNDDFVYTYNVKKTVVTSGMLPWALMHHPDAMISHHPLNPLCAVGPLAKDMMAHNLDGDHPAPHGPNSSWKFCVDHGAKICWLGTDAGHHNTISHVCEEAYGDWRWPDEEWFHIRKFKIIDEDKNEIYKEVYERKPEWGMLRIAEQYWSQKTTDKNIMQLDMIDNIIQVGYMDATQYMESRRSSKYYKKGIPYYKFFFEK